MKRFAGALALVAALALPNDSQGAVFAGMLEMVNNENGTFDLKYRLNEDANVGVTIRIKGPAPLNTVVRTIAVGAQTKGLQTVQWDGKNDLNVNVPNGQYSWEIESSANNGGTGYVKTIDGSQKIHTFFSPYGIDSCDVTTSPHFGKVFVSTNAGTVAASGRVNTDGVYVLSPDWADFTNQGDTAYGGGVTWGTTNSPYRCHVGPDGKVFICDWSDSHSGIWVMDAANPSANFTTLFPEGTRTAGLKPDGMHGSISSMYVKGEGANRVLYTLDEDLADPVGTVGMTGSIWRYPIGTVNQDYAGTRTLEYNDAANGNLIQNFSAKIDSDYKNPSGWWISQYRSSESATVPSVIHYNGSEVDWNSFEDFPGNFSNNNNAGFAVSNDGNLIAVAGGGYIKVTDVTTTSSPTIIFSDTPTGNIKRDVDFDAAGNIMLSSSSSETIVYYSKQGENTFTTPNPTTAAIFIGNTGVESWELY